LVQSTSPTVFLAILEIFLHLREIFLHLRSSMVGTFFFEILEIFLVGALDEDWAYGDFSSGRWWVADWT